MVNEYLRLIFDLIILFIGEVYMSLGILFYANIPIYNIANYHTPTYIFWFLLCTSIHIVGIYFVIKHGQNVIKVFKDG